MIEFNNVFLRSGLRRDAGPLLCFSRVCYTATRDVKEIYFLFLFWRMSFFSKKFFLGSVVSALVLFVSITSVNGLTDADCKRQSSKFKLENGVCIPDSNATNLNLSEETPLEILTTLMQWLLYITGFLAVIAFAISGSQYMLSAGDDDRVETAKRNMIYSIVGVIVAASGLVIIFFVDSLLNGTLDYFDYY